MQKGLETQKLCAAKSKRPRECIGPHNNNEISRLLCKLEFHYRILVQQRYDTGGRQPMISSLEASAFPTVSATGT